MPLATGKALRFTHLYRIISLTGLLTNPQPRQSNQLGYSAYQQRKAREKGLVKLLD